MLEIDGLKYISTPRTKKRGDGAAIIVNQETFYLEKIEVAIPHNVEIVWGLMRPKKVISKIREIIISAFYSPPKSKKKSKLLDQMMPTTHLLLTKYPEAGLIMGDDKKDLKIGPLLIGIPRMKNMVTKPTHKNKILDVILTNLHQFYNVPIIAPPDGVPLATTVCP